MLQGARPRVPVGRCPGGPGVGEVKAKAAVTAVEPGGVARNGRHGDETETSQGQIMNPPIAASI